MFTKSTNREHRKNKPPWTWLLLTWEILYPNHQDYPAAAAAALPVWIRRSQTI